MVLPLIVILKNLKLKGIAVNRGCTKKNLGLYKKREK
jgi:hypothetical protein